MLLRQEPPQPAIQDDPPDEQEPEQADQQAEHPPDSRHQRSENRDPEDDPPGSHTFPIGVVQVVDPVSQCHHYPILSAPPRVCAPYPQMSSGNVDRKSTRLNS